MWLSAVPSVGAEVLRRKLQVLRVDYSEGLRLLGYHSTTRLSSGCNFVSSSSIVDCFAARLCFSYVSVVKVGPRYVWIEGGLE